MVDKIILLEGAVQDYAWGGMEYIPKLINQENPDKKPFAELWIGAHPKSPAKALVGDAWFPLDELIVQDPDHFLGKNISKNFQARLPFLFKILDVKKMLSIQAHPTKGQAEIGFAKENEKGIPLKAPNRVYRDDNHKPEIMVALTDFWLLHGFRSADAIGEVLNAVKEFKPLLPYFEQNDVRQLYQIIMEAPQEKIDEWLIPLKRRLLDDKSNEKNHPDFWAARAFTQNPTSSGQCDRGIFSIYFFNLVQLKEGEGIFQDAGIPHAYLEGVNVELMANSDNVFRGGLTIKHVDVPELLDKLIFDPVQPTILKGEKISEHISSYPSPAPDFELRKIALSSGEQLELETNSPEAFFILSGEIRILNSKHDLELKKGQAALVCAETSYKILCEKDALIFIASVPS